MFEINGKVKIINDTQSFSSGFTKREFVVTTGDSKYPQDIKFEIVKDKCAVLDSYSPGQEVTVNFDVRGNEYNGSYYVNLNCWKISANGAERQPHPPQQQAPAPAGNLDDGEDIPF